MQHLLIDARIEKLSKEGRNTRSLETFKKGLAEFMHSLTTDIVILGSHIAEEYGGTSHSSSPVRESVIISSEAKSGHAKFLIMMSMGSYGDRAAFFAIHTTAGMSLAFGDGLLGTLIDADGNVVKVDPYTVEGSSSTLSKYQPGMDLRHITGEFASLRNLPETFAEVVRKRMQPIDRFTHEVRVSQTEMKTIEVIDDITGRIVEKYRFEEIILSPHQTGADSVSYDITCVIHRHRVDPTSGKEVHVGSTIEMVMSKYSRSLSSAGSDRIESFDPTINVVDSLDLGNVLHVIDYGSSIRSLGHAGTSTLTPEGVFRSIINKLKNAPDHQSKSRWEEALIRLTSMHAMLDTEQARNIGQLLEQEANPMWVVSDGDFRYYKFMLNLLETWVKLDPGPTMGNVLGKSLYSFVNFWKTLFFDNPAIILQPQFVENLGIIWQNLPLSIGEFSPLDIQEEMQTITSAWIREFITSGDISAELKDIALQTVALETIEHTGYAQLADDWSYPPYQLAQWRYVGTQKDAWYSLAGTDLLHSTMEFGNYPINQKVKIDSDIEAMSLQMYFNNLGDIYNESRTINVQVWHNGEVINGRTSKIYKEGITTINLDRSISLKAGDEVEVIIPIQETKGRVGLCVVGAAGRIEQDRNGGLSVERSPFEKYMLVLQIEDVAKSSTYGWQKTGIYFETEYSHSADTNYLIGYAENYLTTYFRSNPDDRLPRTWIAATAYNTTSGEVSVDFKEWEFRQNNIYSDLPDKLSDTTPVYVYGDYVDYDLFASSLMISGQQEVSYLTSTELVDTIINNRPGMLVITTDVIPYQLLTIEDGQTMIGRWLAQGNQLVTAGVLPFENVIINGQTMSTYDYAFYSERSVKGTGRLREIISIAGGDDQTQVFTYQNVTKKEHTHSIELGGTTQDEYIEMQVYKPDSDGSITWMFPLSIYDVNGTTKQYQCVDIFVDDRKVFSRLPLDQFRDKDGWGISKSIYDDIEDSAGNRLFVQYKADVNQTDESNIWSANYMFYLTVRENLASGTHTIRIEDCDDNAGSQYIRVPELSGLTSWERKNNGPAFLDIQAQYQGIPENGAGMFLVTGRDVIVSAEERTPPITTVSAPCVSAQGSSP
jgi:phosphopantetheine adenylyltransferase